MRYVLPFSVHSWLTHHALTAVTFSDSQCTERSKPALQVLTAVKALVKQGISICSTIHSPTAYCFSLFDTLTLLIRGRVIYCGPNGDHCVPTSLIQVSE